MKSLVEYMVGRELMLSDGHRIRSKLYVPKRMEFHYGDWVSVETKNHTRLTSAQLLMRFFIYPYRLMDFEEMLGKLNLAIEKLGSFEIKYVEFVAEKPFSFFIANRFKFQNFQSTTS